MVCGSASPEVRRTGLEPPVPSSALSPDSHCISHLQDSAAHLPHAPSNSWSLLPTRAVSTSLFGCVLWDPQCVLCSEAPAAPAALTHSSAVPRSPDSTLQGQTALGAIESTLNCTIQGYEKHLFPADVQPSHCLLGFRTGALFSSVRHSLISDVWESLWGGVKCLCVTPARSRDRAFVLCGKYLKGL